MKTKNTLIIFILASFLSLPSIAQEKTLTGIVTTFDSIPLIKAEVYVKSTKETVLTDTLGNFTVKCSSSDKIKVSCNGFLSSNMKIGDDVEFLHVDLKLKASEKSTEIAIGYGHVKDAEKLNAIVALRESDVDFGSYNTVFEIIEGRFPGVAVEGTDILVRGVRSYNGNNAALVILDGLEVPSSDLENIPTATIKSVNIIKDGSAATYGANGANGVVIIETIRGGHIIE